MFNGKCLAGPPSRGERGPRIARLFAKRNSFPSQVQAIRLISEKKKLGDISEGLMETGRSVLTGKAVPAGILRWEARVGQVGGRNLLFVSEHLLCPEGWLLYRQRSLAKEAHLQEM